MVLDAAEAEAEGAESDETVGGGPRCEMTGGGIAGIGTGIGIGAVLAITAEEGRVLAVVCPTFSLRPQISNPFICAIALSALFSSANSIKP